MSGRILRDLYDLWVARQQSDEYVGTLVNAWLARTATRAGNGSEPRQRLPT